jgi:hypothetical protein
MPSPAGAINTTTGKVWVEYDDGTGGEWVDATSTPDLSTFAIPAAFKVALDDAAPGVTTAIAQAQKPSENWTETLTRILPNLTMGIQQLQLMQINVDRAKRGLPPVDAQAYSGAYVNVGLDPNTQRLVTYAGIGLLALFVLNMATRK